MHRIEWSISIILTTSNVNSNVKQQELSLLGEMQNSSDTLEDNLGFLQS